MPWKPFLSQPTFKPCKKYSSSTATAPSSANRRTKQIDSFEKLEFVPGAISALRKIAEETDYRLVMVTNQDGLGTDSFPEDTFWPAHRKMLSVLEGENVRFDEILIDRTFPADNAPTRKPGTALLTHYLEGDYDLAGSFVIGDRLSDVQLAKNLGTQAIYLSEQEDEGAVLSTTDWDAIYRYLRLPVRAAQVTRTTKETDIKNSAYPRWAGRDRNRYRTGLFRSHARSTGQTFGSQFAD